MLPYSDRLSRFAAWYVQLWGESLGKQGEGTTPVAALGPVDQHSQLQLYLDGAPQHFITVIREACAGRGPLVPPDLAGLAGAAYLAGHAAGDLVAAQQRAIPEALIAAGRPVRTIDLDTLDEARARRADDAFHAGNHSRGASYWGSTHSTSRRSNRVKS